MVRLAQLVRASDCGSEGQGFETLISPHDLVKILRRLITQDFFVFHIDVAIIRHSGKFVRELECERGKSFLSTVPLRLALKSLISGTADFFAEGTDFPGGWR